MIITGALIGSVVSAGLKQILGYWNEKQRNKWALERDRLRYKHESQIADYEYRKGRNEQIRAIQGQDPRASTFLRWGLSAPVVLTYWFLFAHWWVTGFWYATEFPTFIENLFYAVTLFAFLHEGKNAHDDRRSRDAILADPEYRRAIDAAGERRKKEYEKDHGPKGQNR